MTTLRVGVRVAQYGGGWARLRDSALRAEELGFHSIWANDHLRSPGRLAAEPAFDGLTTLAALAPLTSRVRLGTAVLSASYRAPALAAKVATLLDVISGGRLILGMGTGSHREEHEQYGFPFPPRRERTAGLVRALDVVEAMFADPDGASVPDELRDAPNHPPPVQRPRPPVWLAAHGPVLLRLAGRRADGVVSAFCEPEELARRRAVADEARAAAGGPPLELALYTYVMPVPSRPEADRWLAEDAAALGTTPAGMLRWLRTTGIVGPPEEIRDRLAAHAAAGATQLIVSLPHRVPLETVDALAEATLPAAAPPAPPPPAPAPRGRVADNLVDLLLLRPGERVGGAAAAVLDDEGGVTWEGLAGLTARAAGALAARGVRRGDRVAIALPDGRAWFAAFLGAASLGAVAVPLDAAAEPEALADPLEDCAAAVLVAPAGATAATAVVTPAELAAGPERGVVPVRDGDLAYLVYSSGSTGRPKAAMHAHGDLRTGIETYAAEILGLGPGDRCHSASRLHTSLGFGNGFFRVLGSGATAVLNGGRPAPATILALLARHEVTVLTAVPTLWAQLARYASRRPDETGGLAGLRLAVSSGDGLSATVAAAVREALGVELLQGLGCSECSNVVISMRPGEHADGALGRPVAGVDVALRDEDGKAVPPGEPGRLWIRSPSNTTGYWGRPDLTRDLVHGEWIRMGDMLVERDGRLHHMGRADALFKVDGRFVAPPAVEEALLGHPAVVEAAVVGRADERGLVRAAAAIVVEGEPPEGLTEDLRRRVADAVGAHAVPRTIELRDELPRLGSGKLDRRALTEPAG